jgi:glycosyltransferase involved in cell wall biosynthesis
MTTDAVGGVWVYATALAGRLAKAGTQVTLVSLGPPPRGSQLEDARALHSDVELVVTDLKLEWLDPEGGDTERAQYELLRIADRVKPDLVHLNGYREASFNWPWPIVVVAHSCVLSWWEALHKAQPVEARWSVYAEAVRTGLNAADAWLAPSKTFRDTIERIYQPETFGWVVPNGIDVEAVSSKKEPVILASGRLWDQAKNIAVLARVADELPWRVQVAGAGMTPSAGPSRLDGLGQMAHRDLQQQMRRAAIYASPAHYEPFGLGILEAAAAGCALVLSDIPSLRELWDGAALFVPPDDPNQWRDKLKLVCENEPLRVRLQRTATVRAHSYSLDRMISAYFELYAQLMAIRAHPRHWPEGEEARA